MSESNGAAAPNPGGITPSEGGSLSLEDALSDMKRRRADKRPARNGAASPAQPAGRQIPEGRQAEPNVEPPHPFAEEHRQADRETRREARDNADHGEPGQDDRNTLFGELPPLPGAEIEPDADGEPGAADAVYTVTVDGKPQRIAASELVRGYLREQDYTKKTQGLSQAQTQFQDAFQAFTVARTQLAERLERYTGQVGGEFDKPVDWVALAQTDPIGYSAKHARYMAWQEARAEQQAIVNARAQENAAAKAEQVRIGHDILSRQIPGWRDAGTRTTLQQDMKSFARQVGYSPQELAADITDPRQLVVLHAAMQYYRLANRKVESRPAQESGPPARRTGTGTGTGVSQQAAPSRMVQAANEAFASRPSVDNGLALMQARRAAKQARGRR